MFHDISEIIITEVYFFCSVLSRRTSPDREGVNEDIEKVPEVNTSVAEDMGGAVPMVTDGGGLDQSGPQPNTIPETPVAPESNKRPPSREGGVPAPTATSTNPEAPNTLVDALQSASVLEEHRTLMGTVIERVQSAKSGLDEAFTSLLTGFEVCNVMSFSRFS